MSAFRSFVDEFGLFDVLSTNGTFTWSNNRNPPILGRLDCIFLSPELFSAFPSSSLDLGPRHLSDHASLLLSLHRGRAASRPPDSVLSFGGSEMNPLWSPSLFGGLEPSMVFLGDDILSTLSTHFRDFYSKPLRFRALLPEFHLSSLSGSCAISLEWPFLYQEIKNAVWALGSGKAPDIDGFPVEFFRNFWEVCSTDVFEFCDQFDSNSIFLKEFNQATCVLVPKRPNPTDVTHFHPISIIGTPYKIIAKLLSLRLAPVMHSIISPFQVAFIKGRRLQDAGSSANRMEEATIDMDDDNIEVRVTLTLYTHVTDIVGLSWTFIQQLYAILFVQLLFNLLVCSIVVIVNSVNDFLAAETSGWAAYNVSLECHSHFPLCSLRSRGYDWKKLAVTKTQEHWSLATFAIVAVGLDGVSLAACDADGMISYGFLYLDVGNEGIPKGSSNERTEKFVERKQFYRAASKARKQGYLHYGPPGTRKSNLISAIANFLKFDIYDLECTDVCRNSDLRNMLTSISWSAPLLRLSILLPTS
ncbi:AAA-ATPase [Nymphaea thermarum]|nr:AAA-ATPase [Nymphaea thermarum]